jgi:hypothetical protein
MKYSIFNIICVHILKVAFVSKISKIRLFALKINKIEFKQIMNHYFIETKISLQLHTIFKIYRKFKFILSDLSQLSIPLKNTSNLRTIQQN